MNVQQQHQQQKHFRVPRNLIWEKQIEKHNNSFKLNFNASACGLEEDDDDDNKTTTTTST